LTAAKGLQSAIPVAGGKQPHEKGVKKVARDLGLETTDVHRAVKVAALSEEAKQAARDAGLLRARIEVLLGEAASIECRTVDQGGGVFEYLGVFQGIDSFASAPTAGLPRFETVVVQDHVHVLVDGDLAHGVALTLAPLPAESQSTAIMTLKAAPERAQPRSTCHRRVPSG
jgi:hypothetical protein